MSGPVPVIPKTGTTNRRMAASTHAKRSMVPDAPAHETRRGGQSDATTPFHRKLHREHVTR